MPDHNQDPSVEDILASIRRIISEEEQAAPPLPPPPEPIAHDEDDDVLELTHRVDDEPPSGDHPPRLTPLETQEAPLMSEHEPEPQAAPHTEAPLAAHDPLVSAPAAGVVSSAFESLQRSVSKPADARPADPRTLEEIVREMLRPMLKAWLDEHLPAIVTAEVAAEVERLSRRR